MQDTGQVADALTLELNRSADLAHHLPPFRNHIQTCATCGLSFLNPQPGTAHLKRLYDAWYRYGYVNNIAAMHGDTTRRREFQNYHLRFIQQVQNAGRKLLDVGTGTGLFVKVAADNGWQAHGIDWSEAAIAIAHASGRLNTSVDDLQALAARGERYDVVTMFDYLEHTQTPLADVRLAVQCLVPGGILAIRVPNYHGLQARRSGMDWGGLFSLHLSYFSSDSLAYLLRHAGLEPVFQNAGNYQSLGRLLYLKAQWVFRKLGRLRPKQSPAHATHNNPNTSPSPRVGAYIKGTYLEFLDHFGGWIGQGNQLFMIYVKPHDI